MEAVIAFSVIVWSIQSPSHDPFFSVSLSSLKPESEVVSN
jgi:hypothetical protein